MLLRWLEARKQRRIRAIASEWAVKMEQDRVRHGPGLRAWIGDDPERAEIYNRIYRAYREAAAPARALYGTVDQRAQFVDPPSLVRQPAFALAVLIAAVLAASLFLTMRPPGVRPVTERRGGLAEVQAETFETAVGEVRAVRLVDGSVVTLDTHSRLRVDMQASVRRISLDYGRVRFEVAHDADRPFTVYAGGGSITARGTVFDVEAYRTIAVHLISGVVDVRYPPTGVRAPSAKIRLAPGQQVRFDPAMRTLPSPPSPARASDEQWVTGMKTFDDVPVSEIIEEANRYSETKIVLTDDTVAAKRVFLDLDIRDTRKLARNLADYLDLAIDESHSSEIRLSAR